MTLAKRQKRDHKGANPLSIRPLGNALFNQSLRDTRTKGLGTLARLTDELLVYNLFSELSAADLARLATVSKAFLAFTSVEGVWKNLYLHDKGRQLKEWKGSWRETYAGCSSQLSIDTQIYSDVLYQPILAASWDPCAIFKAPTFRETIAHITVGPDSVGAPLPDYPCIIDNLMGDWPAMNDASRRWNLPSLSQRVARDSTFNASAALTTLSEYTTYHDACPQDESPLYIFEPHFAREELATPSLDKDYEVPECFRENMFDLLASDTRPNFRWIIIGPERSGSNWHKDPNATSAWNAVTTGEKAWVMFPPGITPPGVSVTPDEAIVQSPLSIGEWFLNYYAESKRQYPHHMLQGICKEGQILHVPAGWWHLVVNLTPAIAVTQNYIPRNGLLRTLRFIIEKPEQVSGFKFSDDSDDTNNTNEPQNVGEECQQMKNVQSVLERLVEGLDAKYPTLLHDIRKQKGLSLPPDLTWSDAIFNTTYLKILFPKIDPVLVNYKLGIEKVEECETVPENFTFGFDLDAEGSDYESDDDSS